VKVAVLYGGTSAERDVSIVSGRAIGLALAKAGHEVLLVDPAAGDAPVGAVEADSAAAISTEAPAVMVEEGGALAAVSGEAVAMADVVFVALHGGTGEDGTVQGLLELAGKRYTGSGVLASALAMDKRLSKMVFVDVDVPTPPWRILTDPRAERSVSGSPSLPGDLDLDEASRAVEELGGYPIVVKPNDQGSTVGLTIVEEDRRLAPAVKLAAEYSRHVLVEQYVAGREMTVAVFGDEALPVVEIVPKKGVYDYEAKYTKGMSRYVCPAEVTGAEASALAGHAVRAFRALGCRDYARVDFRLSESGLPVCLEVNTCPGMTETSLVPMAARAAGMGFGALVSGIVEMACR